MITLAQIQAAQDNDLDGIRAVLDEMSDRIDRLASQTAGSMGTNPARYTDYVADFRQDAMVTLFEYLPRWEGDSADAFCAYLYGSIAGVLKAKAHAERNPGADRDAMSVFKAMVERAQGDVYEAERLAQTEPPKGKRLSADRANAARLAWQGAVSIDKQTGDDEGASLADTLAAPAEHEASEIRPKVGTGAALEALAALQWHSAAYDVLNSLPADADGVDAIEAVVILPRDPAERKHVLSALAILRSYVSTATDSEVTEELRTVADERGDERAANIGMVRAALEMCSPTQRTVLALSFGINGASCYGFGDRADDEGMSAETGLAVTSIRPARSKGLKAFAKNYIALAAATEAQAVALAEAAAKNLSRGGRK